MYEIITQAIGFIAIFVNIMAVQFNSHAKIVVMRTIGSFLFGVQYVMLSAYTGVVMEAIGWIRNLVFIYLVKKKVSTKPWILFFSVITVILGVTTIILSWNASINAVGRWTSNVSFATVLAVGISVISIVAKVLSTVAYGIDNAHKIRLLNIPTCSCWLVYNFVAFSLAGILNEIMTLCSVTVAEVRYSKAKKETACSMQTAKNTQNADQDITSRLSE